MIRFLKTKWGALSLGVLIYALTTWLFLHPQKQAMMAARAREAAQGKNVIPAGPSWAFQNPEMNEMLAELQREQQAVRNRETELNALEARLKSEHQEIYSVTQAVWRLQTELNSMITNIGEAEMGNLKKLAKVYSTMSPESAAKILKAMDDDQVVKILAVMKESSSARVLESLSQATAEDAKRAAMLSNRLRLTVEPGKKTPAL